MVAGPQSDRELLQKAAQSAQRLLTELRRDASTIRDDRGRALLANVTTHLQHLEDQLKEAIA
jgi:hypothetical protein